jgi:hypothetical protein
MKTLTLNKEVLLSLLNNARWFAGYVVRWKKLDADLFSVTTNYPWQVGL